VKEAVPFAKFAGRHHPRAGDAVDRRGHGHAATFATAFGKSQIGAGTRLPTSHGVPSVQDSDKAGTVQVAKGLIDPGSRWWPPSNVHTFLTSKGPTSSA
jgi:hypothetical protein